jgi:hypothetical protein
MSGNAPSYLRPRAVERVFGHMLAFLVWIGLIRGHFYVLEVPGRKSGRTISIPVHPLDHDGRRYLISSRGESTWVRNARATGEVVLEPPSLVLWPWITVLAPSNPILITDLADLPVREVDLKHVFRRPDRADRGMGAGVKDFGSLRAVFAGCDIPVVASYIEGQPLRSVAASQGQSFL